MFFFHGRGNAIILNSDHQFFYQNLGYRKPSLSVSNSKECFILQYQIWYVSENFQRKTSFYTRKISVFGKVNINYNEIHTNISKHRYFSTIKTNFYRVIKEIF